MRSVITGLLVVLVLVVVGGVLGWAWLLSYTHTSWPG
jgi:hypothetical protein